MHDQNMTKVGKELSLKNEQVRAVVQLLEEGGTIPFIARYRKEVTGSLDEVAVMAIRDRIDQLHALDKRRSAIFESLEERELLTKELKENIENAGTMAELEDIYLPFRPKRRTRATMAKEKGLNPLAELILKQDYIDLEGVAESYIDCEKGVDSVQDALAGACDIIAERINEDSRARQKVRRLFLTEGVLKSKATHGKEEEGAKYSDYFDYEEPVKKVPSHRLLAVLRAEKETYLSVNIKPDEEKAIHILNSLFVTGKGPSSEQVALAVKDAYKRLMSISIEKEIRVEAKLRADNEAIKVFADNLRQLLLASPLGRKNILAIDPGLRTGGKVVCLDRQGKLLHNDVIFPDRSQKQREDAALKIRGLVEKYQVEAIAIGNGTGGRETESFVKSLGLARNIEMVLVNESGASIYSASQTARDEFPDYDLTVRGAVSIGRRLADPLAELVKIEAKSIGVGQYQHDVDQSLLKQGLDDVVMSCVNAVGVEVNSASKELLTYVSGLGPQLANNIITYRNENGAFYSRKELSKVPRLGPKAFEQAAGFLRISDSNNPLDCSAVHPESYFIVEKMAKDLSCSVGDLIEKDELRRKIVLTNYITESVGLPTLKDILAELSKPGRDPRETFESFSFTEGIDKIQDLKIGMKLPGIITNITAFGAFVDIGVHQDGLVHISQLADSYVKNPTDIVKVHQKVIVTVTDVDTKRKRIALSMRQEAKAAGDEKAKPKVDAPVKSVKKVKKEIKKEVFSNNPFDVLKNL